MSRHGQHVAPLIERGSGSYQAAALGGRLDDDDRTRQPGNDAVSSGEVAGKRLDGHCYLTDAKAVFLDLLSQNRVLAWIDHIDAAGHDGDRSRVHRREVGCGIDPAGEA